jgi:hypothetical protein
VFYLALLTQYAGFFISPFGEKSVAEELNAFLRSHRIVNVEKRLIDGERGTGWVFLIEYGFRRRCLICYMTSAATAHSKTLFVEKHLSNR